MDKQKNYAMGLDISLIKITENEGEEFAWLYMNQNPELLPLFSSYIRIKHFTFPDEEYDEEVFFYEEISYQRKAMLPEFYEVFENDKCLIDKSEVEKMWHYVTEEQKQNFKNHFVDKFINGQTVVTISW